MLASFENPTFYLLILTGIGTTAAAFGTNLYTVDQAQAIATGIAAIVSVVAGIVGLVLKFKVTQLTQQVAKLTQAGIK
jgi:hypothetical protein